MGNDIKMAILERSGGMEAKSVEKLLNRISIQTQYIDKKLTLMIDQHVVKDLQNYYNKINKTLSELM